MEKKNKIFNKCEENQELFLPKKNSLILENAAKIERKKSSFNVEEILETSDSAIKNNIQLAESSNCNTKLDNKEGLVLNLKNQTPIDKFNLSYKLYERSNVREA